MRLHFKSAGLNRLRYNSVTGLSELAGTLVMTLALASVQSQAAGPARAC